MSSLHSEWETLRSSQKSNEVAFADRHSGIVLLRCLILTVLLFGIPFIAIFWDRIPDFKNKIVQLTNVAENDDSDFFEATDDDSFLANDQTERQTFASALPQSLAAVDSFDFPGDEPSSFARNHLTPSESPDNFIPNARFDSTGSTNETVPAEYIFALSSNESEFASRPSASATDFSFPTPQSDVLASNRDSRNDSRLDDLANLSVQELESRLQNLGAFNLRREEWGVNGGFRRVSCQVVRPDRRDGIIFDFESVDVDFERSLIDLIKKIENWRKN